MERPILKRTCMAAEVRSKQFSHPVGVLWWRKFNQLAMLRKKTKKGLRVALSQRTKISISIMLTIAATTSQKTQDQTSRKMIDTRRLRHLPKPHKNR